jgi:hypothetical protein
MRSPAERPSSGHAIEEDPILTSAFQSELAKPFGAR